MWPHDWAILLDVTSFAFLNNSFRIISSELFLLNYLPWSNHSELFLLNYSPAIAGPSELGGFFKVCFIPEGIQGFWCRGECSGKAICPQSKGSSSFLYFFFFLLGQHFTWKKKFPDFGFLPQNDWETKISTIILTETFQGKKGNPWAEMQLFLHLIF